MGSASIVPVFPFNLVFDTDFGLMRLIRNYYRDTKVFNVEMLGLDDASLIRALIRRKVKNPLSIIMNDYNEDKANTYYSDFLNERYDDILKLSPVTGIGRYLSLISKTDAVTPYIWCTDKEYSKFVSVFDGDTIRETLQDSSEILNMSKYDAIFLKSSDTVKGKAKGLVGKSFYVARYGFNTIDDNGDEMLNIDEYVDIMSAMNQFAGILDVYESNKL